MAARFGSNMHIVFRLGLCPRPNWVSLQRSARCPNFLGEGIHPPSEKRKGREGEGKKVREKKKRKGVVEEREGKRRGEEGEVAEDECCLKLF